MHILATFTENLHWHRSRNKYREEPSREQRGKRLRPDQATFDGSYGNLFLDTSYEYKLDVIATQTALFCPREKDGTNSNTRVKEKIARIWSKQQKQSARLCSDRDRTISPERLLRYN
ncbi:hypothetical protein J6590_077940 [Homalodisca vitripennis]|nr:hypothetical protein J6590_077940 [Homalodisca vitripennis]